MLIQDKVIIENAQKTLAGSDAEFFSRVWRQDLSKYRTRLMAIDFQNMDSILDAGFGMGQWIVCLSELNSNVEGIEHSYQRVQAVNSILDAVKIGNVRARQGSIENLDYADNSFDGIFCYGVVFLTDFKKSLKEFYRVLKPGGKLYFTANELGWFLFCLLEEHNKSPNYDPRKMSINAISNSLSYFAGNGHTPGSQLIIPIHVIQKELNELNFKNIIICDEGGINQSTIPDSKSFYSKKEYLGEKFIYEVLAQK